MLAKTTPPNKNMQDGMTESDSAFNLSFLFQHIIQKIKYARHKMPITDKYTISASSNQKLKYVYGILNIIKTKQPYLPVCSKISTALFR